MKRDNESVSELLAMLAIDLNGTFERLVQVYQDRLYAFVLSRIHSPQIAEEIVLDALERAYYALKSYPGERIRVIKLEAWLYEITRNVYYNYLRDSRARNVRLPTIPLDLSENSPLLALEDSTLEPDIAACLREDSRELLAVVESLPQGYRETIKLYYFENLRYDEIAEQLRQPLGTVKSNVHRGTKLLRQLLSKNVKEVR
jgi:RNA polymerase sigma-70 factor (ECF subfamily)